MRTAELAILIGENQLPKIGQCELLSQLYQPGKDQLPKVE